MKTEFIIKGFRRTAATDDFIQHHTLDVIDEFLQINRDDHLRVTVDEDSHRSQNRKPHFVCEVQLKLSGTKKVFKVRKSGLSFHEAVIEAGRGMKRILSRFSDRRNQQRLFGRRKLRDLTHVA